MAGSALRAAIEHHVPPHHNPATPNRQGPPARWSRPKHRLDALARPPPPPPEPDHFGGGMGRAGNACRPTRPEKTTARAAPRSPLRNPIVVAPRNRGLPNVIRCRPPYRRPSAIQAATLHAASSSYCRHDGPDAPRLSPTSPGAPAATPRNSQTPPPSARLVRGRAHPEPVLDFPSPALPSSRFAQRSIVIPDFVNLAREWKQSVAGDRTGGKWVSFW